jgi:hypothetical protein
MIGASVSAPHPFGSWAMTPLILQMQFLRLAISAMSFFQASAS